MGMCDSTPAAAGAGAGMPSPGAGLALKPDAAVASAPSHGVWDNGSWQSNKSLSGQGGGFGDFAAQLMMSKNPALAGMLGSAGVGSLPTMGDMMARNAATPANAGMATPGASMTTMADPAAAPVHRGGL